jgi:hypothetical protein
MKAAARYVIRRNIVSNGQTSRVVLSAREEDAGGGGTNLSPVRSAGDVQACKE